MDDNVVPMRQLPFEPFTIPAPESIRPRPWVFGHWLMRGAVTLIAAPGGTGKTSLLTGILLSCATGKDLLDIIPLKKLRVAFLGLEEGREEMQRRFAAAMMCHGVTGQEIGDSIYYLDGKEYGFQAAFLDQTGQAVMGQDMETLASNLLGGRCDLLVADPLALAHSAPENDNNAMARVVSYFTALAQTCNVAVLLIHHTRKGAQAGDPDGIRGAGALINHARVAIGLAPMSEEEAQIFNLPPDERKRLVRIDDLKMNYAIKAGEARWLKLESVNLGNRTDAYPLGDSIQVATAWEPPVAADGLTIEIANQILDEIAREDCDERFSVQRNASKPAHTLVRDIMATHGSPKSDSWCRNLLGSWINAKPPVIFENEYLNTDSKKRRGLFVNNANRPGTAR